MPKRNDLLATVGAYSIAPPFYEENLAAHLNLVCERYELVVL